MTRTAPRRKPSAPSPLIAALQRADDPLIAGWAKALAGGKEAKSATVTSEKAVAK